VLAGERLGPVDAGGTFPPPPPEGQGESERRDLVLAIARLDDLFQRNEVSVEEYQKARAEMKIRLLRLTLGSWEGRLPEV
jgi:hypothetical protein